MKPVTDPRFSRGQNQLETESNLNCEFDRQESPIDMINETTRMKHLNADDFKNSEDTFRIEILEEKPDALEDNGSNLGTIRTKNLVDSDVMLNLCVVEKQYSAD